MLSPLNNGHSSGDVTHRFLVCILWMPGVISEYRYNKWSEETQNTQHDVHANKVKNKYITGHWLVLSSLYGWITVFLKNRTENVGPNKWHNNMSFKTRRLPTTASCWQVLPNLKIKSCQKSVTPPFVCWLMSWFLLSLNTDSQSVSQSVVLRQKSLLHHLNVIFILFLIIYESKCLSASLN